MAKSTAVGGRPRQSGIVTDDPRDGILTAAASLFAKKGFSATRMNEIAELSGLRQSSIYYWFRSKEQILRTIMDQNRVSLMAARALAERKEPAADRLYIVLYQDVVQMCSAPLNFYDLEEAAIGQPDVFSDFTRDYQELVGRLEAVVRSGLASGEFIDFPAELFVRNALSLNEGSQYRFHTASGNAEDMHEYADAAAQISVRALLADVSRLPKVRQAAQDGVAGFRAYREAMQPTGGDQPA
ncbi:TetR/AcrR family transcriptional regulator [Nesterenkonia muleiensis]|uniref:TetR/AcrR family transcriptional regulator n=1 Tax=Nesterenkonia muleiensis TaxID=2282648 RepID=UPI000E754710|nr:TetR/AcrR family transcriptional regulator [Nesterenkonia muleiensis]